MKRCLITGATGLVGSALWKAMVQEALRYEMYLVCSPQSKIAGPLPPHVHVIEADLAQLHFTAAFPRQMDIVVHLAQSRHFREFPEKAEDIFAVNTMSTLQLLEYCRRAQVQNVVLASSGGVYGLGDEICRESALLTHRKDQGFYATSKFCAEAIAEHFTSYFNIVTLRPFFIYGPAQQRHMLIPRLIDAVSQGKPVSLQGNEGLQINPIHVLDAVRAVLAALRLSQSEKINIAGAEILSLRRLCEMISAEVGVVPVFDVQEGPSQSLVADIAKMKQLLCVPQISLEEGLKQCLASSHCGAGK
jgi:nucleoside-diphosphate-sugar epimerase